MSAEDYFVVTDLEALRQENDLLALENTFLKGRVRALEHSVRAAREEVARLRQELVAGGNEPSRDPPPIV